MKDSMIDFNIRPATVADASFLADAIIEAEKSGTDKLSYAAVFGLSEERVQKYLIEILEEEIDGCELSISSFMVAEFNGELAGAVCSWVEGGEELPSSVIKGNLLQYTLPKECIQKSVELKPLLREVYIEYLPNIIYLGGAYVTKKFRSYGLGMQLVTNILNKLFTENPGIRKVRAHVFSCNEPSIISCKKLGFKITHSEKALNNNVSNYLPSNTLHLLEKNF